MNQNGDILAILRAVAGPNSDADIPALHDKILSLSDQQQASQMTPKQYADAIDRLGLSQVAAGEFLGVDPRQSRRWIAGDARIPEAVAKLLRLMIRLKLKPEEV